MRPTDVDSTYERWSYGEGWTAGRVEGRLHGFDEGYAAGFDAGAETGAARMLLGLERALDDQMPGVLDRLLPDLPHVGAYAAFRLRTQPSNEPCAQICGACSSCIRALAVAANLVEFGVEDRPGTDGGVR